MVMSDLTSSLVGWVNFATFIFPLLTCTYSKIIMDFKSMTKARTTSTRIAPNTGNNQLPQPDFSIEEEDGPELENQLE